MNAPDQDRLKGISGAERVKAGYTKIVAFRHVNNLYLSGPLLQLVTDYMIHSAELSSARIYLDHLPERFLPALKTLRIGPRKDDTVSLRRVPIKSSQYFTDFHEDKRVSDQFSQSLKKRMNPVNPTLCRDLNPDDAEPILNPWSWNLEIISYSNPPIHSHFSQIRRAEKGAIRQEVLIYLHFPEYAPLDEFHDFLVRILLFFHDAADSPYQIETWMYSTKLVVSGDSAYWKEGGEAKVRSQIYGSMAKLKIEVREKKDMPICPACGRQ